MLGLDWKILLGQLINFLILLFVLKKFAVKPFLKTLRERKQKIEEGIEKSKLAEEKVKEIREMREEVIAKANQKAMEIYEKSKKRGDDKVRESVILGEKERISILENARKETLRKISKIKSAEEKKMVEAALLLAEKVIGEKMDAQKDKDLINKILAAQK